jgi:hypothetical protein
LSLIADIGIGALVFSWRRTVWFSDLKRIMDKSKLVLGTGLIVFIGQ